MGNPPLVPLGDSLLGQFSARSGADTQVCPYNLEGGTERLPSLFWSFSNQYE